MTQEEKAKAYDEAIKRTKTKLTNEVASDIFPELKESEDERIRKAIIKGFENFKNFSSIWEDDVTVKDCLVWLEKQAEQKPIVIIPKFRVGDKIWHKNYKGECMHHIIRIENNNYIGDDDHANRLLKSVLFEKSSSRALMVSYAVIMDRHAVKNRYGKL